MELQAWGEASGATLVASQAVRRAAGYISMNGHEPICVGDIATACGTSVRTLYRAFVREHGTTPMQFLRRWRLDRVRAALLAAEPGATVTRVAFEHGVTHLGRFAQEYAKTFGEPPSETLCRTLSAQPKVVGRAARRWTVPGERRGVRRNEDAGAGLGRLGPQSRQDLRVQGVR